MSSNMNMSRASNSRIGMRSTANASSRLLAMAGACVALACAMFVPMSSAYAFDRVVMKDGSTIDGKIVRKEKGMIWIKITANGSTTEKFILADEYQSVTRNVDAALGASATSPATAALSADAAPAAAVPAAGEAPKEVPNADPKIAAEGVKGVDATAPVRAGVPRAMVITCGDRPNGDMVGVFMVANILERAIPVIEKELGNEGDRIVAVRITSGGGYLAEIQKIVDVLDYEYKKRWRTVGWIDSAISAAAMSAHILDEIYMTTQANYGACTGFYGSLDRPVEGFELEKALFMMEKISARAGYDPLVMRAMQVQQSLSATIDQNGNVQYYEDATSGDIVVNRPVEILTFNAKSAEKVQFSKGTADTIQELGKAMGFNEVDWIGRPVKNIAWPVSKAEQMQMDFRKKVKIDEDNTNRYFRNYQTLVGTAGQSQDRAQRAMLVGKARQSLELIKGMVRNNPAFARNNWGGRLEYATWLGEQDLILRNLLR